MSSSNNMSNNLSIVLLAGGVGSRMKSTLPKSLHKVKHIPMISRIFNSCLSLRPKEIVILCSEKTYKLTKKVIHQDFRLSEIYTKVRYEIQPAPNGTGHATLYAIKNINDKNNVLILSGDSPFITFKTLYNMTKTPNPKLLISEKNNPFGYGRIILDGSNVTDIVEEKDCNNTQRKIKLVNGGLYFVNKKILQYLLSFVDNKNKQGEYYLTDITSLFGLKMNKYFEGVECNIHELQNVNTKEQLDICNKMVKL
jgi:bifunctional UDP-N-acetylglucosamine pyrophosphorylase/glucosamine-1-phosphate N-acetyltransferase